MSNCGFNVHFYMIIDGESLFIHLFANDICSLVNVMFIYFAHTCFLIILRDLYILWTNSLSDMLFQRVSCGLCFIVL